MKLKKGDNVLIIAGKDKGRRGAIEKSYLKKGKIAVTGVNIAKHHLKPSRKNPHGGIMDKLAPIDVSNVVIVCPRCGKPARIGYKFTAPEKDGTVGSAKKLRICKKCQESLD